MVFSLLTKKEAAIIAGVSRQTIYNWIEKELLPEYRLKDRERTFISEKDINEIKKSKY